MYTIHRNLQIATGKYLVAHPTVLTSFRPLYAAETRIGHFRNVRGLGKSMVVFRLFEKLKYSNERSTIF